MLKDVVCYFVLSVAGTLAIHWSPSDCELQTCNSPTDAKTRNIEDSNVCQGSSHFTSRSVETIIEKGESLEEGCDDLGAHSSIKSGKKICYVNKYMRNICTSVWCVSSPESGLRCHFQNLMFNAKHREFVFILSPESVIYGIESLKDLESLDLSSVKGHNAFQIHMSLKPWNAAFEDDCIIEISKKTLIMGRFKPDNILHLFHDDLLPIYFSMKEFCPEVELCKERFGIIFSDENERGDYWSFYGLFSSDVGKLEELQLSESEWYCFQDAHIGLNKMSLWYQYGFGKPQSPLRNENLSGALLRQFANYVRRDFGIEHSSRVVSGVILSRKSNRKILNEGELSKAIKDVLSSQSETVEIEIDILSLEENDIKSIITSVSKATILVGVHGSGLILGMFLPPGSVLLEIWPFGINPSAAAVIKTMCELKGFDVTYMPWVNKDFENTIYHPEYPQFYGGLSHLTPVKQKEIISELPKDDVTTLECCDNTEWLFRIYQDTKVNVYSSGNMKSDSILNVVAKGLEKAELALTFEKERSFNDLKRLLYPGRVSVFRCYLKESEAFTKLYSEWQEPWNVADLRCTELKYEVITQSDDENEYVRHEIHELRFLKKLKPNVKTVKLWITCFCDLQEGSTLFSICKLV